MKFYLSIIIIIIIKSGFYGKNESYFEIKFFCFILMLRLFVFIFCWIIIWNYKVICFFNWMISNKNLNYRVKIINLFKK